MYPQRPRWSRLDEISSDGAGLKPAWLLGFRAKRTNLHEKYDYPTCQRGVTTPTSRWSIHGDA